MTASVRWFDTLGMTDVPVVGGKNASLGEMRRALTPWGFARPTASRPRPTPIAPSSRRPASNRVISDVKGRREIDRLTRGYADKAEYFVDRLAEGVAAAFSPKDLIVRLSDFKTNE